MVNVSACTDWTITDKVSYQICAIALFIHFAIRHFFTAPSYLSLSTLYERDIDNIEKEAFKAAVKENVKTLYRKKIEEASKQQIFQAVSDMMVQGTRISSDQPNEKR